MRVGRAALQLLWHRGLLMGLDGCGSLCRSEGGVPVRVVDVCRGVFPVVGHDRHHHIGASAETARGCSTAPGQPSEALSRSLTGRTQAEHSPRSSAVCTVQW
jgi:hypothetical protein